MTDAETIAHYQTRLQIQRRNLAHYLKQAATMGSAYVPPVVANGIHEARTEIRKLKAALRGWNVAVENHPDDDDPSQAPAAGSGDSRAGNVFHFHAPVNAGAAAFGAEQSVKEGAITMGDSINISNVSGSNINVKATLDHVTQTIGALPGDQAGKDEIKRLIEQLAAELQKAPGAQAGAAEQVAKRAEAAVAEAAKPQPDKEDVKYSLERLQKAAANIAAVLPAVLPIATKIAEHIRLLIG